jgi:hypothetical protein
VTRVAAPAFKAVEPSELHLSDAPTIKSKDGALKWYRDVMGVTGMKLSWIVERTNSRELPSFLVSGGVMYSTRDLFHAVMATRRAREIGVSASATREDNKCHT